MQIELTQLRQRFAAAGYIVDENAILTVFLALKLQKPLLIEGAPGVGKTEMGKVLAEVLDTELIRLQCYEGLDETKALYEWNYQRQLLRIQIERGQEGAQIEEEDLFSLSYLLERPLLKAIRSPHKVVLLIDEVDKCDPEFEAFLFEVLSDFQVSIPELGTLQAENIPVVVLTSNSERELSDGLKRRCLYLFFDFPDVARETQIIRTKVPQVEERLAAQLARVVAHLRRQEELRKKPSIAETLDWARALVALGKKRLDGELVAGTLNILLKNRQDQLLFHRKIGKEGIDQLLRNPGNGGGECISP
ncbi:MAG TPA: MoxR family ATPase [Bacillota bacterium]|nr:MoxR family ATPase [Bacillota bacterium]HOA34715.1 MoxR family ATPase [Bacillota bacterium]HOJ84327.1 MoxR family ATPase [Bacillota bacterium]HOL15754.1 MoxR family ATPase [Bacillota bacterium]HPZ11183.1 MoxR family ATPase [Bacillota bacterium]